MAVVWTRANRIVQGDSFHYLSYAKEYSSAWPDQFGTSWPHGYPFIASFFTELGLSAYWSLMVVSVLSLFTLALLTTTLVPAKIRNHWSVSALFLGLGAMPIAARMLAIPASEYLFSALVISFIFLLRYWPRPWAIWGTGFLVFSAFCVRYAGIFMLGVMGLYGLWTIYTGRRRNVVFHTAGSVFVTGAFTGLLILMNVLQTGHMSGAARPSGGGVSLLPKHALDLGWGFIGALSSKQILTGIVGGVDTILGATVGILALGGVFSICVLAFLRETSTHYGRPAALVIGCYLLCMIVLRSISQFQPLYHARFVVPVLFPLGALLIGQVRGRLRTVAGVLAIAVFAVGVFAAGRGMTREGYGDLTTARGVLGDTLSPGDTVLVNHWAQSLSAYYPNAFHYEWRKEPPNFSVALSEAQSYDYAVYAAQPEGRYKVKGYRPLPKPYHDLCTRADTLEDLDIVQRDSTVCVLTSQK
ncbi:hypothetical protein GGQ15_002955 [Salinibacter ruber]|nr:hypothetical protein [Salinibacter ruber]